MVVGFGIIFSLGIDLFAGYTMQNFGSEKNYHSISKEDSDSDEIDHAVVELEEVISKTVIKVYILEAAIAVHSIIIGFSFGMTQVHSKENIIGLIVALSFHQFFEGIGIATAVVHAYLDNVTNMKFALVFVVTFPLGAWLGYASLYFSSEDTASNTESFSLPMLFQGVGNALSAGILLHASLVEMIGKDFDNSDLDKKHFVKFFMYICLSIGFLTMSLLAIWG